MEWVWRTVVLNIRITTSQKQEKLAKDKEETMETLLSRKTSALLASEVKDFMDKYDLTFDQAVKVVHLNHKLPGSWDRLSMAINSLADKPVYAVDWSLPVLGQSAFQYQFNLYSYFIASAVKSLDIWKGMTAIRLRTLTIGYL